MCFGERSQKMFTRGKTLNRVLTDCDFFTPCDMTSKQSPCVLLGILHCYLRKGYSFLDCNEEDVPDNISMGETKQRQTR